ncbi:MAG: HAMP domain-containing protein [Candidatus Aminicenantes bacterium]|nr:HAMP domain-containing protein [Candidatus Aminicenantes bacterium]
MGAKINIKLRLILFSTGVVMVILCLVFFGVYLFMKDRAESLAREKVDQAYDTVADVLRNSEGDIMDIYHLGQDVLLQMMRDGKVVYATQAWKESPIPSLLSAGDNVLYKRLSLQDGRIFLVKKGQVDEYNTEIIYAQEVTTSLESIKNLRVILLVALPCALVLSLLGGYFLAGRALVPVKEITQKARDITADRLEERLPVSNPHDEIGRLATVFNDVLARLESSFLQLRRFTADASHELRTPLTSIRSVGEVALKRGRKISSYREALGSILEEVQRLNHIVDSLLILARSDAGRVALRARRLDIGSLVEGVVNDLRVLAEEKNQTVTLDVPSEMWAAADEATIRLAVTNVFHNAVVYTPQGGLIAVRVKSGEDGRIVIDIDDNGLGIPESEREKVFERFYRIDKSRSRREGGAGLGLSIALWAVRMNGGTIDFQKKDRPGALCRIFLPGV